MTSRGDPQTELLEALEDSDLERQARALSAGHRSMAAAEDRRGNKLLAEYHRRLAGVVFAVAREVSE